MNGIEIEVRFEHLLKASFPIDVILDGIVIFFNLVQLAKAFSSIVFTPEVIVTFSRLVQ